MVLRSFRSLLIPVAIWIAPFVVSAQTATLSFSPSTGSFSVGKTFTINISVDSGSTAINSANATISFDPTIVTVDSVSKNGSAFGLWAVEPTFSNSGGTVNFEGGNTSPISGKKQLLSISFKPTREGSLALSFKDGTVLAADGKGTDVLGDKLPSTYTIGPAAAAPPPPPSSTGAGQKPDPVEVTSTSHQSPDVWYATTTAVFTWENPIDVTSVRLAMDQSSSTVPTTTIEPPVSDKEYTDLKPGENWFHVRLKNDAGWGETTHRRVLVDIAPPEPFTVTATPDPVAPDVAVLVFTTTDALSGLDRYEIVLSTGDAKKLKPSDIPPSGYLLGGLSAGAQNFKVFAYDKAGNKQESAGSVSVLGPPVVAAKSAEDEEKPSVFTGSYILSLILAAALAFTIGYMIYDRRVSARDKWKAKREADEVRERLETIFSVLRQELDEQLSILAQKPNPSPTDREVQERLREALDISEELIDKEVEDVRKLLT
jgi:hypothetical protein